MRRVLSTLSPVFFCLAFFAVTSSGSTDNLPAMQSYFQQQKLPPLFQKQVGSCPSITFRATHYGKLVVDTNFRSKSANPNLAAKRVTVIGSGPTGLYLALAAFRSGFDVNLVEKRTDSYDRDRIAFLNEDIPLLLKSVYAAPDLHMLWPAILYPLNVLENDLTVQKPTNKHVTTICEIETLLAFAVNSFAKTHPQHLQVKRGYEFAGLNEAGKNWQVKLVSAREPLLYVTTDFLVDATGSPSKILAGLGVDTAPVSGEGFGATAQFFDAKALAELEAALRADGTEVVGVQEQIKKDIAESVLRQLSAETPKDILQDFGPANFDPKAWYKSELSSFSPRFALTRSELIYDLKVRSDGEKRITLPKYTLVTELSKAQASHFETQPKELERYLQKMAFAALSLKAGEKLRTVDLGKPFSTQMLRAKSEFLVKTNAAGAKVYITPVGDSFGTVHYFLAFGVNKAMYQAEAWVEWAQNPDNAAAKERYRYRVNKVFARGLDLVTQGIRFDNGDLFTYPNLYSGPLLAPVMLD